LAEVLDSVKDTETDDPLGPYERHLFGRLLQLCGATSSC
jgi:hypothetical protein